MNSIPHLPAWRLGRAYESLDRTEVRDHRTGEVRAQVSTVNAGIVRRDLPRLDTAVAALRRLSVAELIARSARAGELFLEGTLPLGAAGQSQTAEEYVRTLSSTSGLPWNMVRRNMRKIHHALSRMGEVLHSLSRGLDLGVLDTGVGQQAGVRLAFGPTTQALGLVMPSNSPAVNSLWLPALALKTPVILKPGRDEPWTPYRLLEAFRAAGMPGEAFGFYPTDHEGAGEILRRCGRALVFGDQATTAAYAHNPAIQVHGPGWSKIVIGEDCIDRWPEFLDVMVASVGDNGGRSCINASAIVVPRHADAIADALAARLGSWQPAAPEDPEARLAGFANPKLAEAIDLQIEEGLRTPGARDVTTGHRPGPRKVVYEGGTYLCPTVVRCASFAHPLANREFLFPYTSIVELPVPDMLARMGYSLAVTAITRDPDFTAQLLAAPTIDRLNLGPVPTTHISWDQPHEGNLFEFLWRRRSIEQAW
jgi:acyl-CoA reductase-like NAD-dependent aldehyde dehydrogenase